MIRSALDLVGLPYRVGGRGPEEFDCAGVVIYALPDLAAAIEGLARTGATVAACVRAADVSPQWERLDELAENCVVAISRNGKAWPHIGVLQRGRIVHAADGLEVVADTPARLGAKGWRQLRGYRFIGGGE